MMLIGIWKIVSPETSSFRKRIYQVYSVSFHVFCYSAAISLLAEIPTLAKSNMVIAMDNANRFTVYVFIIIKMIAWQSKRMVDLRAVVLRQDSEMLATSQIDPVVGRLYRRHVKYNHKFIFVLVASGTVIPITILAVGWVNIYQFMQSPGHFNATEKPLPQPYWYPFDRNEHYLVALVDQNVRPTLSCFCLGVTSASLNSLAIFVRVQLKVLQHYFQHFHRSQEKVIHRLKLLCVKHQRLITYTKELSESLQYIVLLDYTVSSVTFALMIVQITTVSDLEQTETTLKRFLTQGEQFLINFVILIFTTLQLLTFSWNCNEIIVQSMELAKALFESDWYDQGRSVQKLIYVMMMRCQKPLYLRIGWLGVMDLNAGISRLKLGYSYTSIMNN
ncbi:odorant receptor 30a-like isoform X2 [Cylas formicarius]|uniref:odorant receptor 30a-like isoform X2 n=1 Tax=Cylas formicarius TaxID=197179 RepID=UPI0029587330|nr:odorant receptor 30a-like isoform X2 [Cylas formicarius]